MKYSTHEIQAAINEAELSFSTTARDSELAGTISVRAMRILIEAAGCTEEADKRDEENRALEEENGALEDEVTHLKTIIKRAANELAEI